MQPQKMRLSQVAMKLGQRLKRKKGIEIEPYHAGKSSDHRTEIQNKFMSGNVNIIVATIAFGMGLNKSDVRGVIHFSMPKTMEHYVEEIGRSGRDGLDSECHVFYDRVDIERHKSWIYMNGIDLIQIKRLLFDIFSSKNVKILRTNWRKKKQKKMKKIFKKKKKGKQTKKTMEEYDFSDDDQEIDDDEDDAEHGLVLTEFKGINDIVTISKDKGTENKYDAFQIVLGTIFTYLDVYKSEL